MAVATRHIPVTTRSLWSWDREGSRALNAKGETRTEITKEGVRIGWRVKRVGSHTAKKTRNRK